MYLKFLEPLAALFMHAIFLNHLQSEFCTNVDNVLYGIHSSTLITVMCFTRNQLYSRAGV